MKKTITLLLLVIAFQVVAQTYPITNINISMPPNPDATMANWGKGNSVFVITATGKSIQGHVDGFVEESRILVTIKKRATKVCGSYTANSAPASNFNTVTKVWSGTNAVSLIGQDCILSPGDYELCVQFFGYGAAGAVPLSEEKCKMFSIRGNESLTYQPPQAITPVNGTVFSEIDIKKPITFRWTPVIPKPQEPVTYRLKVWQLMQGQNGMQAMKTNPPIVTKDVDNLTQATILNLITGPCKPPYLCDFIWNVQSLDREGEPMGGKDGMSEALQFIIQPVNDSPSILTLITPVKGSAISAKDKPKFTWTYQKQEAEPSGTYKIKIVEILGNESPEDAIINNKTFFEKDGLTEQFFQYPSSAPSYIAEKKYGWNVSIFDRWGNLKSSTASMFFASNCDVFLALTLKSIECLPPTYGNNNYKICVSATYTSSVYNLTYSNAGSNFTAYAPSYSPTYPVSNLTPTLQIQNSGSPTTVNYCFDMSVPAGQTSIKIGLQGDDKNPGPMVCQPGTELDLKLPNCIITTCGCGSWSSLIINKSKYACGNEKPIKWTCNKPVDFSNIYQCIPNDKTCQAITKWEVTKGNQSYSSGAGSIGTFTPTTNGTYTLVLYAECNGKKCPPCSYTFVVGDCKPVLSCVTPPLGMVGWWPGDNNANDISGNNNNGTIHGGTTYVSGKVAKAFNVINSADYISIRDNPVLNFGTGSFSIDVWVNTTNKSNTLNIVDKRTGTEAKPLGYGFFIVAGKLAFQLGDGQSTMNHISNVLVNDGKWNLVAVTIDRTIKTGGKLYVNGNVVFTFDPTNRSGSITNTAELRIGQRHLSPATKFKGQIDEVEIFNRVLLETEIDSIFLADTAGKCKRSVSPNDLCDCGTWSKLTVQTAAGTKRYECGSEILWSCKTPFQFTNSYQCLPNDKSCLAKTTWEVKKGANVIKSGTGTSQLSDEFNLLENGTYTLSLNTSCNSKECKPCTYTIVVENCIDTTCNCGKWGELQVTKNLGDLNHQIIVQMNYKCDSNIITGCNQLFNFASSYLCNPNNESCQSKTAWEIKRDGISVKKGNGLVGDFTPTANGTYTLTLNAECNDQKCRPCIYTFVVNDCSPLSCECSKDRYIIARPGELKIRCQETKIFDYGTKLTLVPQNICNPAECLSEWNIKVYDAKTGANVTSGSGTGNNSSFALTLNSLAGYRIELTGNCNGKKCKCEFWIRTKR